MLPFLVAQAPIPAPVPPPPPLTDATRDALLEALADARKAEAAYAAVLARFGPVEPFLAIADLERRGQEALLDLFRAHQVEIPPNPSQGAPPTIPATLPEACALGVKTEEASIAMYERLLSQVRESDVRMVLSHLQESSRSHHLPAFRACAKS